MIEHWVMNLYCPRCDFPFTAITGIVSCPACGIEIDVEEVRKEDVIDFNKLENKI